jgi:hypothetical protein
MRPTVFIHTNPPQLLGAIVSSYSFKKMSPNRDRFDVKIINLVDYPHLTKREGKTYRRKGSIVTWHNRDLQSFSPLRFLPPQLMNYEGQALVVDPDVFAVADVYELLTRDMQGKAILCRRVPRPDGNTSFYASSVMLLNCSLLKHWQWEQQIDQLFNHEWDYGPWIFLQTEPPDSIGELEEEWNHFDILNEHTQLLHNTERSTQPWKTGLPVDFNLNYSRNRFSLKMLRSNPPAWIKEAINHITNKPVQEKYQQHPDINQENLFFSLLKECMEQEIITGKFVKSEIQKKHIRPDVFDIMKSLNGLNLGKVLSPWD